MSSTLIAPYKDLGPGGDYTIEANYGIRIYDDKGEEIPKVGETAATLKGGLRTNYIGIVPILNGDKNTVGKAEVKKIICCKPLNCDLTDLMNCGFNSLDDALDYVKNEHGEEYNRDGVITIYYYKVIELN